MERPAQILVLGATGEMGARVMRLLAERAPEAMLVGAARRARRGVLALDVRVPPPLDLLAPGDVVIDVVGPYEHDPSAWVRACADASAHFIDLSERPEFNARVYAAAPESPCALLSGCSTLPALAASMLRAMVHAAPATETTTHAEVLLSMGTRHPPSAGLLYSLLRPLGRVLPDQPAARAFRALTRRTLGSGVSRRYGRFPCPPLDVDCPARFWSGFDRGVLVSALRLASYLLPAVPDSVLRAIAGPLARLARPFTALGTEPGSLRIERHRADAPPHVLEIHAPRHGLDVPALPAVWAALRLVGHPRSTARALDELIPASEQLAALERQGCQVQGQLSP